MFKGVANISVTENCSMPMCVVSSLKKKNNNFIQQLHVNYFTCLIEEGRDRKDFS